LSNVAANVEAPPTVSAATDAASNNPATSNAPAPQADVAAISQKLDSAIREAIGNESDDISVSVQRLTDGASASVNGNRVYYAASLFKLAVLYEVEHQRTTGDLDITGRVTLTPDDVAEDLGTLSRLGVRAGDSLPIETALRAMVTYSDNSTAVALLRLVGAANADHSLRNLGILHTDVNTRMLPTTADDMAKLMAAIVQGTGLSPEAAAEMRSLLEQQEVRAGIPAGLPAGVTVGNKTGTWDGNTHDVAFVDAPGGAYVIAVLSDRGQSWQPIENVSRAVFTTLSEND